MLRVTYKDGVEIARETLPDPDPVPVMLSKDDVMALAKAQALDKSTDVSAILAAWPGQ